MSVSGAVLIDLRDVAADRAHSRMACLPSTPTGARVIVIVGPLRADPHVVRLLREHTDRLAVELWGEVYAVQAWTSALHVSDTLPTRGAV